MSPYDSEGRWIYTSDQDSGEEIPVVTERGSGPTTKEIRDFVFAAACAMGPKLEAFLNERQGKLLRCFGTPKF